MKHYSGLNLAPVWFNIPHYTSHTSLPLSHHQCTFQCLIIFLSFYASLSFQLSLNVERKYKRIKLLQTTEFPGYSCRVLTPNYSYRYHTTRTLDYRGGSGTVQYPMEGFSSVPALERLYPHPWGIETTYIKSAVGNKFPSWCHAHF